MNISISGDKILKEDYNMVVSCIILSQKNKFTYDDVKYLVEGKMGYMDNNLEKVIKDALIRLRDDNFLNVLGRNYRVMELRL